MRREMQLHAPALFLHSTYQIISVALSRHEVRRSCEEWHVCVWRWGSVRGCESDRGGVYDLKAAAVLRAVLPL